MSKFAEKLIHEPSRLDTTFGNGWNSDFKTEEYANFAPAAAVRKRTQNTATDKSAAENAACEDWILQKTGGYAQAYVPRQMTLNLISGNKGIVCGSIFADLIKPYPKPAPNASLSID